MTAPSRGLPDLGNSRYLFTDGAPTAEYKIFLSSGSDLDEQRDLFHQLANTMTDQAVDANVPYRIRVRRWEDAVSRKTFGDGNREFRHDAATAHLVVVLLNRDLRKGTREELDAAIKASDTQVAVLWLDPPDRRSRKKGVKELYQALDDLKDEVRWNKVDSNQQHAVAVAMTAVLTRVLIDISARVDHSEGTYSESR